MKHTHLLALFGVAAFAQQRPALELVANQPTGYCRASQTLLLGRADNFASNGPELPAQVSPALQAYVTSNRAPTKGFDDPREDRWVVGSWTIPGCRVCRDVIITLSLRRKIGMLGAGDTLAVGAAPFAGPSLLAKLTPWVGNALLTKTVTITIPMLQFNQFILNQPTGPVWLDFIMQDDTEVDFAQLTLVQ